MLGEIKVSAGKLNETAETFSAEAGRVRTISSEMMELAGGLSSIWTGSASAAYISKLRRMEGEIGEVIALVQRHSSDLREMAALYDRVEAENESSAAALGAR